MEADYTKVADQTLSCQCSILVSSINEHKVV